MAAIFPDIDLNVVLTQHHIDNGNRDFCSSCPIALALIDVLKTDTVIQVNARDVILHSVGAGYVRKASFYLPNNAVAFIKAFDTLPTSDIFSLNLARYGISPMTFTVAVDRDFVRSECLPQSQ